MVPVHCTALAGFRLDCRRAGAVGDDICHVMAGPNAGPGSERLSAPPSVLLRWAGLSRSRNDNIVIIFYITDILGPESGLGSISLALPGAIIQL